MAKKYRPSNGTEGDCFIEQWCDKCERDAKYRESNDGADGCQILADALIYSYTSPDYPNEWTYDDNGKPCCTAFIQEGETIRFRDDKTIDLFQS